MEEISTKSSSCHGDVGKKKKVKRTKRGRRIKNVCILYVLKLKLGIKAKRKSYFGRKNYSINIELIDKLS